MLLYVRTAAPGIVTFFDDSLELQLVGPTFGIAHPTGYPLYTLLGGIWSRVLFPMGNWAWRMNLFSALTAAATVVLVVLSARRLASAPTAAGRDLAAMAAGLAFALAPVWWRQATLAEVYALHGLFVAAVLYVALGIEDGELGSEGHHLRHPNEPSHTQFAQSPILLLCALIGLSLAHHRTTLLLLPGLAVYGIWRVPVAWRPQRAWLAWGAALLAPLLLYAYIPIRAAMGVRDLQGEYVPTWAGFWQHVLATGYAEFFQENVLAVYRSPADWLALFQGQVGWPYLALAAAGLAVGFLRRERIGAWALVSLVFLANLLFALRYQVGDVEVFLLPAFLCLALWIGQGVALPAQFPGRWRRAGYACQVLLLAGLIGGVGGRGPAVDRSQDWAAHDLALALAQVDYPPESRVVGLLGEMTALRYMQRSNGLASNALPVAADDETRRRSLVEELIAGGYPVYLTRELPGIESRYSFGGEGPLVRVWPRGEARPGQPDYAADPAWPDSPLRLDGYDLAWVDQRGGPLLQVALYWRSGESIAQTLKVSLRVQDTAGAPLTWPDGRPAVEDRFPLHQVAPTWAWLPGEVVRDVHRIDLPPGGPAQARTLLVILYDAETVAEVERWTIVLPE